MRKAVFARLGSHDGLVNWGRVETMTNIEARVRLMDECGIDMQVLTTPSPPLDELFDVRESQALARVANDGMAEILESFPGRFIGTATLSLVDPEDAAQELTRAVNDLGFRGGLIYSSVNGRAMDGPEYEPLYSTAETLGVPLWLHPEKSSRRPDYVGEDRSLYGLYLVFGWPYETTIAMARLVLSGVMQRHPDLKVIAHHAGAMIPRLANRIGTHYRNLPRIDGPEDLELSPLEYFKRFWVDTITQGSVTALQAAYDTYGPDKMLFATDMPFGADSGREFVQIEIDALRQLQIPDDEKDSIWGDNLLSLCCVTT